MTDPTTRDLIERLADELDHYTRLLADDRTAWHDLATEARAALAAEPQGEVPTDEELDAKWSLPAGTVASWGPKPPADVAAAINRRLDRDIARAVIARRGRPTAPPADSACCPSSIENLGSLISWLTEASIHAADAGRSNVAGMLCWAAQVVGDRVDEDAPAEGEVALRPLLEQVARMGDRIGANTVGEIMVLSDRARDWLRDNPPGQPIAIEPRGCPIPGACACVEPVE